MTIQTLPIQSVDGPFTEPTWDFQSDDVCWLLDYWEKLRGDQPCPRWTDVDLMEIYHSARAMTVKDAVDDGTDFLVRFWGTELTKFLTYDATGKKMSEYYPQSDVENALMAHRLALLGDTPVRRWGDSQFPDRGLAQFEMIHLPLNNDNGERTHVITLTTFSWSVAQI